MKHQVGSLARGLGGGLGFLLLFVAAGCAGRGTVSGTISFRHKPLSGGKVTFQTEAGKTFSGDIKDGEYKVANVPAGPAKISVWTPEPPTGGMRMGQGGPAKGGMGGQMPPGTQVPEGVTPSKFTMDNDPSHFVKIPDKYNDPDKSGLTYTVKGGTQTNDIDLP